MSQFETQPSSPQQQQPKPLHLLLTTPLLYYLLTKNTICNTIVHWLLHTIQLLCLWMCILVVILYKFGYVKRLIVFFTERELTKALNNTTVTISNMEVDFLLQRVEIFDLVIHTPQREEWRWDSPLIGRVGRLSAHVNILSLIDHPFFVKSYSVKDIYSVLAEDIQVFVEKRRNVFNFHLCDETLEIPNSREVLQSMKLLETPQGSSSKDADNEMLHDNAMITKSSSPTAAATSTQSAESQLLNLAPSTSSAGSKHDRSESCIRAETRANEIVTTVIGAVSTLGRAANEGGKEGLHLALQKQKDGFVHHLKQLQAVSSQEHNSDDTDDNNNDRVGKKRRINDFKKKSDGGTIRMEQIALEGMRVMQQVGKVVEKNVSNIKEQVDSFSKPPPKKVGFVSKAQIDLFRVGGVVVKDLRVFTKDMMMVVPTTNRTGVPKTTAAAASKETTNANIEVGLYDGRA